METEDVHDFTCRNIVGLLYKQTLPQEVVLFTEPSSTSRKSLSTRSLELRKCKQCYDLRSGGALRCRKEMRVEGRSKTC